MLMHSIGTRGNMKAARWARIGDSKNESSKRRL